MLVFTDVFQIAFVVKYTLSKDQLDISAKAAQFYNSAQKMIMNLPTGQDKDTCSIFMLLTLLVALQDKVFLLKANAGQADVVAAAMKHKGVFLGTRQAGQEWLQAHVQVLEIMLHVAAQALSELSLLRVKHNAN